MLLSVALHTGSMLPGPAPLTMHVRPLWRNTARVAAAAVPRESPTGYGLIVDGTEFMCWASISYSDLEF